MSLIIHRNDADIAQIVIDILNTPIHRFVGLDLADRGPGFATLRLFVAESAATLSHTMHGGVLSMIAEPAAYIALYPHLPVGRSTSTVGVSVQMLRSVEMGQTLMVTGRLLRVGRQQAFCEVEALADDRLCMRAQIVKAILATDRDN